LLQRTVEVNPMHVARPLRTAALLSALVGLPGCTVRTYPPAVAGYATVYAGDVPVDIYAYPHVYYDGSYVYLVGDRWYYPTERGWVVLRGEPPQLYRYRTTYVQRAPSAYPGYYRGYERRQYAPPAPYGYPPPATRVR
jgi:hypothetical protein